MKHLASLFLFMICMVHLFAMNDPLPMDESVKVGKLANGLTYYIQENGYPKGKALLWLVVKAGSFHEEEYQRGLAHFTEHMMFRGTKHFKDDELIPYLESIGAKFGPDANAFTNFDVTAYMLEIPLDKEEVLDRGILILSDWAGRATLETAKIENERQVIMDEFNMRKKTPQMRVMTKSMELLLPGSRYVERQPLGQEEVIRKCDPEAIREFYKKWYRTDRMAVIAVGDFDMPVVESYIQTHFDDLKVNDHPLEEPDIHFRMPEKSSFIVEDPESQANLGGFALVEELKQDDDGTKKSLQNKLSGQIFESILNKRLNRASKKQPAPYLAAFTTEQEISSTHRIKQLMFVCFEDRPLDGLKVIYEEIASLHEFGPTEEEWKSALQKIKEEIEQKKANLGRIEHKTRVTYCVEHFMRNVPYVSLHHVVEAMEGSLRTLKPADLIDWAKKNIDLTKYHTLYITSKKDLISGEKITGFLNTLAQQKWVRPASHEPEEFEVKKSQEEVRRMNLLFYPTQLEKKEVQIQLIGRGGAASFPIEWIPSLELTSGYLIESGLGNLDGVSLNEMLEAKDISFQINVLPNSRTISISGKPEYAEFMFQLIRASFLEKRYSMDAWNNLVEQHKEIEKGIINNPYFTFFMGMNEIIHSHHPFFGQTFVKDAKEEFAHKILEKAFSDPEEFTMMVVGDFDKEKWQELADRYLNFGKGVEKMDPTVLPLGSFPKEDMDQYIRQGKEVHCYNVVAFQGEFSFTDERKTFYSLQALNHLLQKRCLEKLRLNFGETYGVRLLYEFPFTPNLEELYLYILFTCEPDTSEKLKSAVSQVIQTLLQEGPTDEEVATEKEILLTAMKKDLQSNKGWMDFITGQVLYGTPIEERTNDHLIEKEVTKKQIHLLAKALFEGKPSVKITLVPEEFCPKRNELPFN